MKVACTIPNDEIRTGLADAYADMAQQALDRGDRFEYGLWMRAADIALGFVPRPGTGEVKRCR
jgi:hypothetical protein